MSEVVYGFIEVVLSQLAVDWSHPGYGLAAAVLSILLAGKAWDIFQGRKAVRAASQACPEPSPRAPQPCSTPPPRAYAQMVSARRAADRLERYIRDRGESRWMPKEMIFEEHFLPMCARYNITVASYEAVYRQMCQQIYCTKARIRVLSSEFNYLYDYIESDRASLLRVFSTQEIQLIQAGKLTDMLSRPRPANKGQQRPNVAQRKKSAGQQKRKLLPQQANTWAGLGHQQDREAA